MTNIYATDSMEDIQSKLNKGGNIQFAKGVYNITKQLIIPKNTSIDFNGAILRRKAAIQSILLNKCGTNTVKYKGDGNITLTNGTFEGMAGYGMDNLVTFFHSHDVKISKCTFLDSLCHALELNSTSNSVVSQCKFLGYNCRSLENAYKEMIQLDYAGAAAFYLSGSTKQSKCYDLTCCSNITIDKCEFNKSTHRDFPSTCIGTHCQPYGGNQHSDITISNNKFTCGGMDKNRPCLSIIGMKNVIVENNAFYNCGRMVKIYTADTSYTAQGVKRPAMECDGICNNIAIQNNTEYSVVGTNLCNGVYVVSAHGGMHSGISILRNVFKQTTGKYYAYIAATKTYQVNNNQFKSNLSLKIVN